MVATAWKSWRSYKKVNGAWPAGMSWLAYRSQPWNKWPATAQQDWTAYTNDAVQRASVTDLWDGLVGPFYMVNLSFYSWPTLAQKEWNGQITKINAANAAKKSGLVSKVTSAITAAVNPVAAIAEKSPALGKILDPSHVFSGSTAQKAASITAKTIVNTSPVVAWNSSSGQPLKRRLATIGDQATNPVSASGETIDILGYNIAGTRAMKKTVGGAVAGYATGGPWGAVVGGLAANFQKGKAQTVTDVITGAAAGYGAKGVGSLYKAVGSKAYGLAVGALTKTVSSSSKAAPQPMITGQTIAQRIVPATSAQKGLSSWIEAKFPILKPVMTF